MPQKRQRTEPTILVGRRRFTAAGIMTLLGGVTITISGCGGGSGGGPSGPNPVTPSPTPTPQPSAAPSGQPPSPPAPVEGAISANHGHRATLSSAQLAAGGAVELDIEGVAGHSHTVSLSAGQVDAVARGSQVQVASTNNLGHAHNVTFN